MVKMMSIYKKLGGLKQMNHFQLFSLLAIAIFYIAYITKMLLQKRKGIQTDQIAKGNKKARTMYIEKIMKVATFSIVLVEVISICFNTKQFSSNIMTIGICLAFIGDFIFILAMWTMKDSWRAGIPEKDKTKMISTGIYRISRNPAFLGFDLVYIGILLAFFNIFHAIFAIFAIVMLHLQIHQEEAFLPSVFGEDYLAYKRKTARYFLFF